MAARWFRTTSSCIRRRTWTSASLILITNYRRSRPTKMIWRSITSISKKLKPKLRPPGTRAMTSTSTQMHQSTTLLTLTSWTWWSRGRRISRKMTKRGRTLSMRSQWFSWRNRGGPTRGTRTSSTNKRLRKERRRSVPSISLKPKRNRIKSRIKLSQRRKPLPLKWLQAAPLVPISRRKLLRKPLLKMRW